MTFLLAGFLFVPLCTGLRLAGRTGISEAQSDDCVIVANLHFRKSAGTTVRNLFQHPDFVAKYGWQKLGFAEISDLKEVDFKGKFWYEQHGDEDILTFNQQVAGLRALVEPKGCRVVTTVLFRSPVEQALSEYTYFCNDGNPDWVESGKASFHDWATHNPEHMFHMMLYSQNDEVWQGKHPGVPSWKTCGEDYRELNSCESACKTLNSAISQIDIAGRVDSVEDFSRFWVQLGDAVGFDPLFHDLNSEEDNVGHAFKENLTSSEYAYVASRNPCYSKWYAEEMKPSGSAFASSRQMDKRVITLSSLWKDMVFE